MHVCYIVTVRLSQSLSVLSISSFSIFRFPLSAFHLTSLCSGRVCPLLPWFSFFPCCHWNGCLFPHWFEPESEHNVNAPELTFFCFSTLYLSTCLLSTSFYTWRNFTITSHLREGNPPSRNYAIWKIKFKKVFHISSIGFKDRRRGESVNGLLDELCEYTAQEEWKCSVMAEHGRLEMIRDHLFLSEHKASGSVW